MNKIIFFFFSILISLSAIAQSSYKIAVILPLQGNKMLLNQGEKGFLMQSVSLDYLEGILIASDSLNKLTSKINIKIYDNKDDINTTKKIITGFESEKPDLIIGPLDKAGFSLVSKFGSKKNIPVVSPFSNANFDSDSNQLAFYCQPRLHSYADEMLNNLDKVYEEYHLIFVNDSSASVKKFSKIIKEKIKKHPKAKFKEISFKKAIDPKPYFTEAKANFLIYPGESEYVISTLIKNAKDYEGDLHLVGFDEFLNLKTTDYTFWEKMKVHILASYYLQDSCEYVSNFRVLYKQRFLADPSEFAVRGFDQMLFFGLAMASFGPDFTASVLNKNFEFLHNGFKWNFSGRGIENTSVNIMKFESFRLHKLP